MESACCNWIVYSATAPHGIEVDAIGKVYSTRLRHALPFAASSCSTSADCIGLRARALSSAGVSFAAARPSITYNVPDTCSEKENLCRYPLRSHAEPPSNNVRMPNTSPIKQLTKVERAQQMDGVGSWSRREEEMEGAADGRCG